MGYSTKQGNAALPKPYLTPNPSLTDFGAAFENTGGAIGDTQVLSHGPTLIDWIGSSADEYTVESLDIQDRAIELQGVLTTIDAELTAYSEIFQVLVDTTIPDYQEQWDEAITTRNENVEFTLDEMERARSQTPPDVVFDETPFNREIQRQNESLEETQAELARLYNTAVCQVDDAAGTAATNIAAALDLYVPRGADGGTPTRADVGDALFGDNGGILGAQTLMDNAAEDADDAAGILSDVDVNGLPTVEAMTEFNEKYGERLSNDPFFATAFMDEFGIDNVNAILGIVGNGNYTTTQEHIDATSETLGYFGAGLILATGGTNEVPDEALSLDGAPGQVARDRRAVWDAWDTADSGTMFTLGDTSGLHNWRAEFQADVIDAGRSTWDGRGQQHEEEGYGTHGYAAMVQIMALAGDNNPNLVLGDSFLNGPNSVAHDIVAWDNETPRNWLRLEYGASDLNLLDSDSIDPVYNMFGIMDGHGDATQTFLASDINFTVDHDYDRDTDEASMNMTQFLVGHRHPDEFGQNWPDQGDALGELLNDATWDDPHSEESATIALGFIEGYTGGLAIEHAGWPFGNGDRINGEDVFGHHNSGLRSWTGFILDDYMSDIAGSIVTPGDNTRVIPDTEGFKIVLDDELRDALIGNDASNMFIDLAFDSPQQNEDGTWVGGRPPALNTLIDRSLIEMNIDMVNAMGEDGSDEQLRAAISDWGSILDHMVTSPEGMETEVSAAVDERNAYLQGLINKGVGAIPFSEILTESGHKYIHGQVKNLGLLDRGLEAILPTDGAVQAADGERVSHNDLEILVREQVYTAASNNTHWEDGIDPYTDFAENDKYKHYNLLDDDGNIIPYNEMTPEQRSGFEEWLRDHETGAGEQFREHLDAITGILNDAQQEAAEATPS